MRASSARSSTALIRGWNANAIGWLAGIPWCLFPGLVIGCLYDGNAPYNPDNRSRRFMYISCSLSTNASGVPFEDPLIYVTLIVKVIFRVISCNEQWCLGADP